MSRAIGIAIIGVWSMTPGWVTAADPRIQSHDPQQLHWLMRDPSLPANVADMLDSFPSAGAMWLSAPTQGILLTGATDDEAVVFYHGDHLGSAHVMTDRQGALVQEIAYYPFGEQRHSHQPGDALREP